MWVDLELALSISARRNRLSTATPFVISPCSSLLKVSPGNWRRVQGLVIGRGGGGLKQPLAASGEKTTWVWGPPKCGDLLWTQVGPPTPCCSHSCARQSLPNIATTPLFASLSSHQNQPPAAPAAIISCHPSVGSNQLCTSRVAEAEKTLTIARHSQGQAPVFERKGTPKWFDRARFRIN